MATITQTIIEETLTFTAKPPQKLKKLQIQPPTPSKISFENNSNVNSQKPGLQICPPGCLDCKRMTSQLNICPPDCKECKEIKSICPPNCLKCSQQNFKTIPLLFNAIGIVIAVLATYLMISTDSHLYLVVWVVYTVVRKMMMRSTKSRVKTE